jgi:hypothetical protein
MLLYSIERDRGVRMRNCCSRVIALYHFRSSFILALQMGYRSMGVTRVVGYIRGVGRRLLDSGVPFLSAPWSSTHSLNRYHIPSHHHHHHHHHLTTCPRHPTPVLSRGNDRSIKDCALVSRRPISHVPSVAPPSSCSRSRS